MRHNVDEHQVSLSHAGSLWFHEINLTCRKNATEDSAFTYLCKKEFTSSLYLVCIKNCLVKAIRESFISQSRLQNCPFHARFVPIVYCLDQ
jgi:hypothetical protein